MALFSHSSIPEFGGGHTIKQLPPESPDLSMHAPGCYDYRSDV